jgi:predicted SnoaL-like aldol condensation-catalyzing enzyme
MSDSEPQPETNAEIANRWVEGCLSTGYRELIDAYAADGFVGYASGIPEPHRGPEELKQTLAMFREGFPDLTSEVLNSCADGDMAAVHWVSRGTHEGGFMNIEPTGTQVEFEGMEFVRFEDAKIIESHVVWDALGVLGELRVVEPFRE